MKTIRRWALLLTLLAIALILVFLAGCSTAPKKPSITPTTLAQLTPPIVTIHTNVVAPSPRLLTLVPVPLVDTNILAQCLPANGVESVTLTWTPPDVSTNTIIESYTIYYGSGQVTNWTPTTNWCRCYTQLASVGDTNTITITNLVPGLTYYFACQAEDTYEDVSDLSDEVQYYAPYLTLTNFSARLTKIGNLVRVSAKVCPDSVLSVLSKQGLSDRQWTVIATNLTPDVYGNFVYDYPMTKNTEFISLQIQ